LPEFSSDKIGTSLVIVRSKRGQELMKKAIEHKVITVQPISFERIMVAQSIFSKARKVAAQRFLGKKLPFSNISMPKPSNIDVLDAFHFTLTNQLFRGTSRFSQLIVDSHIVLSSTSSIRRIVRRVHRSIKAS
jgi:hypothetical protein